MGCSCERPPQSPCDSPRDSVRFRCRRLPHTPWCKSVRAFVVHPTLQVQADLYPLTRCLPQRRKARPVQSIRSTAAHGLSDSSSSCKRISCPGHLPVCGPDPGRTANAPAPLHHISARNLPIVHPVTPLLATIVQDRPSFAECT